ncbi:MAG: hypothetical protein B0D92_01150 [Spirochaeta sp. LUC14_002_19_P3]|nr:MAG: hypothetical protein B0D92_01150 [Spirochaeta sp. LUC14_002_19_P3]
MANTRIIGIVGGVGPYAGLDINTKIFDNTSAGSDQEHLEVYLLSCSKYIADRTEYLNSPDTIKNPAFAMFNVIEKLSRIGAELIGIPCNTAHSPAIFNQIKTLINKNNIHVELLHMIEEVRKHICKELFHVSKIGLLCTLGTYRSEVYQNCLAANSNLTVLVPEEQDKVRVHSAIYDKDFGIKAVSNPVTEKSVNILYEMIEKLKKMGAQAIIEGCTEIPLALKNTDIGIPLIDPASILARALIAHAEPGKLKQVQPG